MFGWSEQAGGGSRQRSKASLARKRRSVKKWSCEPLEKRRLLANVTWISNTSGDWSVGSNWNTGAPPQPGDNVIIDVPGVNLTVTYSAGGVLPLGNLTNTELLVIGGGGATWQSGTWDGSGKVQITSNLAISGSASKILKDGQGIDNFGTTTLAGTGNIVGQVGASIVNESGATFNIESDASITFPSGVGTGIFENGGTLIKSGGGTAPGDFTEIGGAQGFTFENSINELVDLATSTPGDCQVLQGTLELGDSQNVALTEGGTFEVSAGATLDYNLGTHNIVVLRPPAGPNIIPSITGAGTLEISGGAVQFYGKLAIHEIDVSAGSLLLQQNMSDTSGTPQRNTSPNPTPFGTTDILRLTGGETGGNGGGIFNNTELPALVVGTTFQWTGGNLTGSGRFVIDATVTSSTISSTAPKAIIGGPAGGFGLDLLCETIWTDSGTITMNGGSAIYIHNAGTLWDQGNGTITAGTVDTLGGNIWNTGIFLKLDGTGITTFGPGINFINDLNPLNFVTTQIPIIDYADEGDPTITFAKLDIRTGTISMQGTSLNRDTYLIHPGATLSFDAGDHQNQTYIDSNQVYDASILGVDGGGSVNFGDATFDSDLNSLVDVPTVSFGAGNYSFDNTAPGAQVVVNGVYNGAGTGVISGNGTIEVKTAFAWNSGTFAGTGSGTSSLQVDPGAVLTLAAGTYTTSNDYNVVNNGTIRWNTSPGTLSIGGNYDQGSTGVFDCTIVAGSPDALDVSGTVTLAGSLNLAVQSLTPVSGQTFTLIHNTGILPVAGIFAGLSEGARINVGSDTFLISYVGNGAQDVVLTSIVIPTVTLITPAALTRPLSGVQNMVFTVQLSTPLSVAASVGYATTAGTAIAGVDYTTTVGTLTFPAGQTSATISVPVIGTAALESVRTFTLTLSNPVNCVLGSAASGVGTIVAVNGPPVISFQAPVFTIDEDAGAIEVTVKNSNPSIPATVQYSTSDGTAAAGIDYTAASGTLSFPAGINQLTFSVPIADEGLTTGQKQFNVTLANPTGNGVSLGQATAVVVILYNNGVNPALTISSPTINEPIAGQVDAVFSLSLSAASTSTISVLYSTADGTATAGKFVPQSGTITFAPGQTTAQISVPVNADFTQTATQTFSLDLNNPVNVTLPSSPAVATLLSQALMTVPVTRNHPFRYVDTAGLGASISLVGPGTCTVDYLTSAQDGAKQVVLSGTTAASQLLIRTAGGETDLENIIVNGSIGAIVASPLRLSGELDVTGGLKTLRMNSLLTGSTVTVGSGAGISGLSVVLSSAVNSSLSSGIPLTSLHVGSWLNANGSAGIVAPAATLISATQNLDVAITLTGGKLNSLVVGGEIGDSVIDVSGSVGSVVAGTMSGSAVFAGVVAGFDSLPTSASVFTNTTSEIGRLTVRSRKSGAFANTLIAAPVIGNVVIGDATVSNGGSAFGIAGKSIASVRGTGTSPIKLTDAGLLKSPFNDTDFQVHLVT